MCTVQALRQTATHAWAAHLSHAALQALKVLRSERAHCAGQLHSVGDDVGCASACSRSLVTCLLSGCDAAQLPVHKDPAPVGLCPVWLCPIRG